MKLLKRSGRGHEPEGIEGTKPGQCAVECPVCPHPGRNLSLNWNEAPEDIKYVIPTFQLPSLISVRWKYRLILAMDANFRMKNKERNTKDTPALGDGWAHFIPETPYMEHVRKWGAKEHASVRFPAFKSLGLVINALIARPMRFRTPCCRSRKFKVFKGL